MINDLSIKNGQNYQKENNIDSSDILAELSDDIKDNRDILCLLSEQLSDMKMLGVS